MAIIPIFLIFVRHSLDLAPALQFSSLDNSISKVISFEVRRVKKFRTKDLGEQTRKAPAENFTGVQCQLRRCRKNIATFWI